MRCRLLPEEFDSKRSIAVPPNRTKACRDYIKEVNEHIIARSEEFRRIITELEACVKPFVPIDIAAACRRWCDLCVIRKCTLSLIEESDGHTVRT